MNKQTLIENDAMKAIVSLPGWAQWYEAGGGEKVNSADDAYCYVPLIYRAVNLRVKSIQSVPYHLESGGKELTESNFPFRFESFYPQTFRSMLGMTEAALLLNGGNIWKKRKNARGSMASVQWISPSVTDVRYQGGQAWAVINGQNEQEQEMLPMEDVVLFRKFHPRDDVGFGIGNSQATLTPAKLLYYMNAFAGQFFEHGAMPVVLLGVPNGTSNAEVQRLEGWFKRATSGIRNAFKTLAVRTGDGGITPTTLTPKLSDLAMAELYEQAKQQVAQAFEIPQTMLEDAANYATASEHRTAFWNDTVRPDGEMLRETINQQLLADYNMELVFDWDQMDQFQEDEEQRSAAFFNYVTSKAIPPSIAAEMLGLELPDGADYPVLDEWYREQTVVKPMMLDDKPTPEDEETPDNPRKAYSVELRKWQSHVLNRIKRGKSAVGERSFESAIIDAALIAATEAQLADADETKARRVFEALERWQGYP